jgi:hypothetical protein
MLLTELVEKANESLSLLIQSTEGLYQGDMVIPNSIGKWSIKDVINHITAWEEEAAKAFEIWKVGIEPDWNHINDLDEFNNANVKQRRKISLSKVIDQLQMVHNGVIENIKSVSDDEYINRGGMPKWLVTLLTSHLNEHTQKINAYKSNLKEKEQSTA